MTPNTRDDLAPPTPVAGDEAALLRELVRDAALAAGCICPVIDNARGKGIDRGDGRVDFWIVADCPLHAASPAVRDA